MFVCAVHELVKPKFQITSINQSNLLSG